MKGAEGLTDQDGNEVVGNSEKTYHWNVQELDKDPFLLNTPDGTVEIGRNLIGAKTLDLNVDFRVIAAQLDKIASDFFTLKTA